MSDDATKDRPPIWESHIRPMFRLIDREHMKFGFDLGDYDSVKTHAEAIANAFDRMPPAATGGPWPHEWIALFRRWMTTGFGRLDLVSPEPPGYTLEQSFEGWRLSAQVELPNEGYHAWLEVVEVTTVQRAYKLYAEAPADGGGQPVVRQVEDEFERGSLEGVVVEDREGKHEIGFPS